MLGPKIHAHPGFGVFFYPRDSVPNNAHPSARGGQKFVWADIYFDEFGTLPENLLLLYTPQKMFLPDIKMVDCYISLGSKKIQEPSMKVKTRDVMLCLPCYFGS